MSITDTNLAAFLDETAFTIKVRFQNQSNTNGILREYRYVANDATLKVGDAVVVPVQRNQDNSNTFIQTNWGVGVKLGIATVVIIDKELDIPANNNDLAIRWIVAKLDLAPAAELLMRNAMMTSLVSKAYRKNIRSSFAANILERLDNDDASSLKKLLGKS